MYTFKAKIWKYVPEQVCGDLLKKYKSLKDDYYSVIFFESLDEMYEWYDKKFGKNEPLEHNYSGLAKYDCFAYYKDEDMKKLSHYQKKSGYICYAIDYFDANLLTHEIAHAVTFYFKWRIKEHKKIFNETNESNYNELFAYILGGLARQINDKYYEIIKKD